MGLLSVKENTKLQVAIHALKFPLTFLNPITTEHIDVTAHTFRSRLAVII